MSYTVEPSESGGYMVVRHEGRVTATEVDSVRHSVIEMAGVSGIRNLLIDLRNAATIPGVGEFYFAVDKASQGKRLGLSTAILARPDQSQIAEFIATTAVNRGIRLKAFQTEAAALDWFGLKLGPETGAH